MSILTDGEIEFYLNQDREEGGIEIDPLVDPKEQIQPASVDLRLGSDFVAITNGQEQIKKFQQQLMLQGQQRPSKEQAIALQEQLAIDPRKAPQEGLYQTLSVAEGDYLTVPPNAFLLGTTIERVYLPTNIVGRVEGKSSFGRFGIAVHSTAGFIDPGFDGQITLEIYNHAARPVRLHIGDAICQVVLEKTNAPAKRPYGCDSRNNKYQGQKSTTPSKSYKSSAE